MTNGSKIKLLLFTPTLQCGGAERFVSLFCRYISLEQFAVCLVVLNNAHPFYIVNRPGIDVIDLQESRVRHSLFKLKKVVKAVQPDVVFSTANHLNLYFAIFRNHFPGQIKFIARESSIVSINTRRHSLPWLYNLLMKKYFRRFDMLICQGAYMQQDLVSQYRVPANKTTIVYNGTEAVPVKTMPAATEPKVYKFITVSRLSEEKGIERLIHAVGLLMMPVNWYIIGDGDKKEALQQLINELQLQEKIHLCAQRADPFEGMEDADLFLMGSYYEGFPNSLLEAGARGIPVVAFHAPGGISEVITDGENGILVEDNDLIAFASAINRAVAAGFNRDKIIESTQKRFSVSGMVKQLENILLQL